MTDTTSLIVQKRYDAGSDEGMTLFMEIVNAIAEHERIMKEVNVHTTPKAKRTMLANDIMHLIAEPKGVPDDVLRDWDDR